MEFETLVWAVVRLGTCAGQWPRSAPPIPAVTTLSAISFSRKIKSAGKGPSILKTIFPPTHTVEEHVRRSVALRRPPDVHV